MYNVYAPKLNERDTQKRRYKQKLLHIHFQLNNSAMMNSILIFFILYEPNEDIQKRKYEHKPFYIYFQLNNSVMC